MPNFYVYLISSLPMLNFEAKPPFPFEVFLSMCAEFIPQKDFESLKAISGGQTQTPNPGIIKKIQGFDTILRNELVRIRAAHKKIDPEKYLRPDGYTGQSIYHIALAAHRNPSPLEGERILDKERWNFLDELSIGHYFDLDFLIVYASKLLILERWERINRSDKASLLEGELSKN
ncbi:MAG: DUF2764 family protein [Candidatus Omnitrophota bacterium]